MTKKYEIKIPAINIIQNIEKEIKSGNLISALFLISSSLESYLLSNILQTINDDKMRIKIYDRLEKANVNQLILINLILNR